MKVKVKVLLETILKTKYSLVVLLSIEFSTEISYDLYSDDMLC